MVTSKILIIIHDRSSITAVALTTDNKFIVSGGTNGEILIWDKVEHKNIKSLHIHTKPITNIIAIGRPRNLYGLNANIENIERAPLPDFQK